MRLNINLPDELVEIIDKKAKALFLSRSAYIATALSQKIQADSVIEDFPQFMQGLKELQESVERFAERYPETVANLPEAEVKSN